MQLNIFVQALDSHVYREPFLLTCLSIENKKAPTLFRETKQVLEEYLTPEKIRKNFKFLITDGARGCISAAEMFRKEYNITHFTCLAHNIHLVCDEIHKFYKHASNLMKIINMRWSRQKLFVQKFTTHFQNAVYTPYGDTRWGTWLQAAVFFYENFQGLKNLFESEPEYYKDELLCMKHSDILYKEFEEIYFFRDITKKIISLETNGLTIEQQMELYFGVEEIVKNTRFHTKFTVTCSKNKNLSGLFNRNKTIKMKFCNEFKYLNLTNCSVERSFSIVKNIRLSSRSRATMRYVLKRLVNK